MICAIFMCIALASSGPGDDKPWFTLHGDPKDQGKNLIEIQPEPINVEERVLFQLRVSRDRIRTSFRGHRYRSYYAKVEVHCPSKTAWYLSLTYYVQPHWKGKIIGHEEFVEGEAPVLFKDIVGEPYKAMISSACKIRA